MNILSRFKLHVRINYIDMLLQLVRRIFLSNRILIKKSTSPARIQHMVEGLWPVKTDKKLIRLGDNRGGGYLVPEDLEGISACFSPGVSESATFERQLFEQYHIGSHLADFSVSNSPTYFKPLSFSKKFIGGINNDVYITLESWIKSCIPDNSLKNEYILQMDIEGGEYLSILNFPEEMLSILE